MKETKIEYYESAETAPFLRYQKFNKFLSQDAEVGSDMLSLPKRIARAKGYNKNNDPVNVAKELSNIELLLSYIEHEYSPKGMANAVMVRSIDGVKCEDISSNGLSEILKKLSDLGISNADIEAKNKEIKKKFKPSLKSILRKGSQLMTRLLIWRGSKTSKQETQS